jgi:methylase of polypeptide subunit release factors
MVWSEGGVEYRARWRSEGVASPPRKVEMVGDATPADSAYRLACEGTALLYRGDYQNARQLLAALGRRVQKSAARRQAPTEMPAAFHAYRLAKAQEHQVLSKVLVPLDAEGRVELARAPDLGTALEEAWGSARGEPTVLPLRELLGLIGAREWHAKGVEVPALGARVIPHYGVFAPVRGEYVDLVAQAPLGRVRRAFDVGTGTGVLALVLAKRGVLEIVATDADPRAVACAQDNVQRLGASSKIRVEERDLFPEGRADLVVFNPPWLPGKARTPIERALYDPEGGLLERFLGGVREHLEPDGEAWLVLSDLAEHLRLREPGWLSGALEKLGLEQVGELTAAPKHPRASDPTDPLHAARSREATHLHRLRARR